MPVGAPLGTITFSAGEGSIGTAAVNPVGVATITVTAPSETGTFTITAVYSGNALFATSTSAGLSVTLSGRPLESPAADAHSLWRRGAWSPSPWPFQQLAVHLTT